MFDSVHSDWLPLFNQQRELILDITSKLDRDYLPGPKLLFRAFEVSPFEYRVLILGQDPYPNPEHTVGLSFAVPKGTRPLPPSLKNILQELRDDLSITGSEDIALWQSRGVMLLNRHLTTKPFVTAGHISLGWDRFTSAAVSFLNEKREGKLVAILWGSKAQEIKGLIPGAHVISSVHPSPLSSYRGFFGSKPFSQANTALIQMGEEPIDWSC